MINKFIGIGNLCKDVELKMTNSGKSCLKNTIAIRKDYKNSDGEYESEFVDFVVWGSTAEYLSKYAEKGMKICIEGRINTRSYDREDGTRGYITEILCNSVELLGRKEQQTQSEISSDESKNTYVDTTSVYEPTEEAPFFTL